MNIEVYVQNAACGKGTKVKILDENQNNMLIQVIDTDFTYYISKPVFEKYYLPLEVYNNELSKSEEKNPNVGRILDLTEMDVKALNAAVEKKRLDSINKTTSSNTKPHKKEATSSKKSNKKQTPTKRKTKKQQEEEMIGL